MLEVEYIKKRRGPVDSRCGQDTTCRKLCKCPWCLLISLCPQHADCDHLSSALLLGFETCRCPQFSRPSCLSCCLVETCQFLSKADPSFSFLIASLNSCRSLVDDSLPCLLKLKRVHAIRNLKITLKICLNLLLLSL